jgi:hypothetical protein
MIKHPITRCSPILTPLHFPLLLFCSFFFSEFGLLFQCEQESGSTMHSFFGFIGYKIKKSTQVISGVLVSEAIQS